MIYWALFCSKLVLELLPHFSVSTDNKDCWEYMGREGKQVVAMGVGKQVLAMSLPALSLVKQNLYKLCNSAMDQ